MRQALDKQRRLAWRSLYRAFHRIFLRIDADLERVEIGSLVEYDVLYTLYEAPEKRLRLAELADAVLISRSGLTRLVDRLEKAGFLRREASTQDRRGIYAILTDDGVEQMRKIWAVYSTGIATYFGAHLSDSEAATIQHLFDRLDAMQTAHSEKV
jgi:DNA-binding MarR family transcriptional regulator